MSWFWPHYLMVAIIAITLIATTVHVVAHATPETSGKATAKVTAYWAYYAFFAYVLHAGGFW